VVRTDLRESDSQTHATAFGKKNKKEIWPNQTSNVGSNVRGGKGLITEKDIGGKRAQQTNGVESSPSF